MKPLSIALTFLLAQGPSRQDVQTASVEGFVVKLGTSEPVARARVHLNVDGAQPRSMTATTDGGGKFVFENVPPGRYQLSAVDGVAPGDYKLFAWEAVEPGAWQDPDFIRAFEDSGRTVHVGEGTRETAEVRVIPNK